MPAFLFTDSIIREIRSRTEQEQSLYKSALWNSGAVVNDPDLASKVEANDGRLFTKNFYHDLPEPDDSVANGPTYPDDSQVLVPTHTLTKAEYQVVKNGPVASWDIMSIQKRFDFMRDPIAVVTGLLNEYWAKYLDKSAIAQMTGLLSDSVANHGSDLLIDISDGAPPGPANTIQNNTIILAEDTAGDAADFGTLVMHSKVHNNLRIQNLIDFIPSSDGQVNFSLYQGKIILVSDQVPVDNVTFPGFPIYTTYLLGSGVFNYGSGLGDDIIGFEQYRDPRLGLGAGLDQIISRQQFALHPMGYNWTDNTVTGSASVGPGTPPIYPNMADQALEVNWTRAASDRKYIKVAAIYSHG